MAVVDVPEAVEVDEQQALLVGALGSCREVAWLRVSAAAELRRRGDDRGVPLLLMATGATKREAKAAGRLRGLCLRGLDEAWAKEIAKAALGAEEGGP